MSSKTICTYCGQLKDSDRGYYKSYSVIFKHTGKISVCKDCVIEIYSDYVNKYNDSQKAIYYMCRLLDVYFEKELYEAAKKQAESKGSNLAQIYFQKANSLNQYKDKTFDNSIFLYNEVNDSSSSDISEDDENENINENISNDAAKRWRGFKKEEVIALEEIYDELIVVYEHDTPIQKNLYRNIAITQMKANKSASAGNMQEYDKLMKTLSTLMNDANIKPVQETGSDGKGLQTWGEWIKKIEETEPIPEPRDEFKDVDGIRKYIDKWFVGHLKKIFGLDNSVTEPILEKEGE